METIYFKARLEGTTTEVSKTMIINICGSETVSLVGADEYQWNFMVGVTGTIPNYVTAIAALF